MLNIDLSPNARILFFVIDDFSGQSGRMWWHWRKMAVAIGVGKGRFFALVNELVSAGLIDTKHESVGGKSLVVYSVLETGLSKTRSWKQDSRVLETGLSAPRIYITEPVKEPVRSIGSFGCPDEQVQEAIWEYPRAAHLKAKGMPDMGIVQQVKSAAVSWECLVTCLRSMNDAGATPSLSWAWFPVVIAQRAGGLRRTA